ncbi:CopG family transcriptional regulator (plasmid) [Halorubrum sp. BOL3-1]|nr:CopG family transcriptional regulator [Halorubrum sp. BOL3-1]
MNSADTQDNKIRAEKQCLICDSTDNIVKHSFTETINGSSTIDLCVEHKQLFKILGSPDSPNPARSVNSETQQTQKVTVRIPRSLIEAADATAEAQGQTRSELVRDALEVYVELEEINSSVEDLLLQATRHNKDGSQAGNSGENTAFLKQRIRKLESLLEDSIEKI